MKSTDLVEATKLLTEIKELKKVIAGSNNRQNMSPETQIFKLDVRPTWDDYLKWPTKAAARIYPQFDVVIHVELTKIYREKLARAEEIGLELEP